MVCLVDIHRMPSQTEPEEGWICGKQRRVEKEGLGGEGRETVVRMQNNNDNNNYNNINNFLKTSVS